MPRQERVDWRRVAELEMELYGRVLSHEAKQYVGFTPLAHRRSTLWQNEAQLQANEAENENLLAEYGIED